MATDRDSQLVDRSVKRFETALDEILRRVESEIVSGLADFDIVDGRLVRNAKNTRLASRYQEQLAIALTDGGYAQLADQFVASYDDLAENLQKTFDELGIPLEYTSADVEAIVSMKNADLQGFAELGRDTINDIQKALLSAVINQTPMKTAILQIKSNLEDDMKRYANTYARTAMNNYSRTLMNMKAEDAGIDKFVYRGSLSSNSRQFCIEMAGEVRTKKQIDEMQPKMFSDGSPHLPNVLANAGGWNCNHRWIPVAK